VNSSLTFRPSARLWVKRRWWASQGCRPQIRQGCCATNLRCSRSRMRVAEGRRGRISTIRRAELEPSETKLTRVNDQAIRRTLEEAGVLFIDTDGGAGPGVRLKELPTEGERRDDDLSG
jgi:hypothetical protein